MLLDVVQLLPRRQIHRGGSTLLMDAQQVEMDVQQKMSNPNKISDGAQQKREFAF
jgi:hypothetical protein